MYCHRVLHSLRVVFWMVSGILLSEGFLFGLGSLLWGLFGLCGKYSLGFVGPWLSPRVREFVMMETTAFPCLPTDKDQTIILAHASIELLSVATGPRPLCPNHPQPLEARRGPNPNEVCFGLQGQQVPSPPRPGSHVLGQRAPDRRVHLRCSKGACSW